MRNIIRKDFIRKRALEVLNEHKLLKLPIDVFELAKKEGFELVHEPSKENKIAGFLFMDQKKKLIAYTTKPENSRTRFTVAHELGHYYLHSSKMNFPHLDNSFLVYRDNSSSKGIDIFEIEANRFAAELLMPEVLIKEEVNRLKKDSTSELDELVEKLIEKFEVSEQAMVIRLSRLGLVSI